MTTFDVWFADGSARTARARSARKAAELACRASGKPTSLVSDVLAIARG